MNKVSIFSLERELLHEAIFHEPPSERQLEEMSLGYKDGCIIDVCHVDSFDVWVDDEEVELDHIVNVSLGRWGDVESSPFDIENLLEECPCE